MKTMREKPRLFPAKVTTPGWKTCGPTPITLSRFEATTLPDMDRLVIDCRFAPRNPVSYLD